MRTVKLSELFDISRGVRLTKAEQEPGDIPLVTAGEDNYGINGYISNGKSDIFEDVITVDMFCHAIYRDYKFYCDDNIIVLIPKKEMTLNEKLYYALCISQNKYKFGYGRQLRLSRLDEIQIPTNIPDWVYEVKEPDLSEYKESFNSNKTLKLNIDEWQEFNLTDLFDLKNGKGYLSSEALENPGDNPFVCSSETNNGIACYTSLANTHKGNCLTINKDGSVGCAFYQKKDFSTNKHVIVATPTFKNFNQYIAMFLIPIIELEKFKYCFGRAWGLDRMETTIIKLPATQNGEPDYEFMEEYIKTLPYSKHI